MNKLFALAAVLLVACGAPPKHVTSDGGCKVQVQSFAPDPGLHVPVGSDITWSTNPPSSGTHYPIWAAFQEFDVVVPRGYYVHDLEHGAVVFLYNCALADGGVDGGSCAALVQGLRDAVAAMPADPVCAGTAVRVRAVITPDPLITTPVAAAAWGWTWTAQCVDEASLQDFAKSHAVQAPENECANGVTSF
jgi:hypothetical protein